MQDIPVVACDAATALMRMHRRSVAVVPDQREQVRRMLLRLPVELNREGDRMRRAGADELLILAKKYMLVTRRDSKNLMCECGCCVGLRPRCCAGMRARRTW